MNNPVFVLLLTYVIFSSIKVFLVLMEMQQWFLFVLLSSNKTFGTNNVKVLSSSCKEHLLLSDFNQNL